MLEETEAGALGKVDFFFLYSSMKIGFGPDDVFFLINSKNPDGRYA